MDDAKRDLEAAIGSLVRPLNGESFSKLRRGIFESTDVDVMQNERNDFAFLFPRPSMDYTHYKPRSERLKLKPSRDGNAMRRRLDKVAPALAGAKNFLEIGAAEGGFLKEVRVAYPEMGLACIEPDQATKAQRDELSGLREFGSLEEVQASGTRFDVVGFFHVFEHIEDPATFLARCAMLLAPGGRLVIEVPALTDPLLSLYKSDAYQAFYFQQQHPFVYSGASLSRVLEQNSFAVDKVIPYQRYGLDNHLTWLTRGVPGGDPELRQMLEPLNENYCAALERNGTTDTVIVIARARP